ncbi:hypothetical protein AGMMS50239_26060 [Bacteroidia bacterium]|nr:hypothetical protein AGMMS50239_26060 [Bacteroidia bacterium]
MISLKNICDDIILTATNGILSSSRKLSFNQVATWVNQYRALLIKRDIDKLKKDAEIPNQYTQMLYGLKLNQVPVSSSGEKTSSSVLMETDKDLPTLTVLHDRPALLNVYDLNGNVIQTGGKAKSKFQKFRRYTCSDYIAYLQDNKLRVEGPNLLEYIDAQVVADNPAEIDSCGFENGPYPIPEDKIPILKQMIFVQELGMRQSEPSDTTTNSQDDTVNNQYTLSARTRAAINRNISKMDYGDQ